MPVWMFESLHSDQGANVDGAPFKGLCNFLIDALPPPRRWASRETK